MKLRFFCVAAAGLWLFWVGGAVAQADRAAAQKAIEAQYARFGKAFKSKDLKALMALGTADLTVKSSHGETLTRAEFEKRYQEALQTIRKVTGFSVKIEKMTLTGNKAVTLAKVKLAVESKDELGVTHVLEEEDQSRDTWVKTGKGWLLMRSEELKSKAKRDGKPFDPNAAPGGGQQ